MIRNTQSICLITLCFNIMIYDNIVYGVSPVPNCNICNNDIYIKYPGNQINVSFLGFDDMVEDMISCQQLYDAGNTHFITEEQCTLIHTNENGIQLQTFCGCSSLEEDNDIISLLSSPIESSTSLSQLKVLQLIKEPEMKIEDIESSTVNVTVEGNMTQNIEAYENNTVKPVVDKPTKLKEPKSPVVVAGPVSSSGGGKLKSPVLKPNKSPIDVTVAMPTAPVIASGPVFKKSSPTVSQSMSTSKPNIVMKPTIKIKDTKGGNVAPVAVANSPPTTTTKLTKPILSPKNM